MFHGAKLPKFSRGIFALGTDIERGGNWLETEGLTLN